MSTAHELCRHLDGQLQPLPRFGKHSSQAESIGVPVSKASCSCFSRSNCRRSLRASQPIRTFLWQVRQELIASDKLNLQDSMSRGLAPFQLVQYCLKLSSNIKPGDRTQAGHRHACLSDQAYICTGGSLRCSLHDFPIWHPVT